ncbi:NAD kinase-like isoform X3 [Aphidius gifuensis]|uniref:NAD kinase-like isoform X3 n=1 Tax=Aphidius gifuensis TaxID=684658 RepID=UPI001CDC0584|nr:NAD kinase-like isoform X3 [Aphidius gifuensis]XP_044004688.1 NAD kinase-like isoform X3 [Aphidius gifuensis]
MDQISMLKNSFDVGYIDGNFEFDPSKNGNSDSMENGHKNRVLRRTRSLNAPSPIQQFGPCGRIMKNSAMVMTIQDPASQRLTWYKPPSTVLVIKKVRDSSVLPPFVELVTWLVKEKSMQVHVEASVMEDQSLKNTRFADVRDQVQTFKDETELQDKIDFIICLGGDGTLLYASLLFQQSVPPVMAFHLGSLGFLTPFEFDNFQEQVTNVLEGHAALTLRSRLRCIIMRKGDDGQPTKSPTNLLVLNEVVIDRGPSPYLSNIDLFIDGKHVTSVQGDGLIVSTPTGSTAYAVAAGASMIHPSVPAIMITPICPHSLSFRPIVVPAGVELKISVSPDSRNTSWVSFDGRNRQELFHGDRYEYYLYFIIYYEFFFLQIMANSKARSTAYVSFDGRNQQELRVGDSLRVTTSIYPVPSICAADQITDWFDSLAECLHWNVRKRQKHLDELSDLTHSSSNDTLDSLDRDS